MDKRGIMNLGAWASILGGLLMYGIYWVHFPKESVVVEPKKELHSSLVSLQNQDDQYREKRPVTVLTEDSGAEDAARARYRNQRYEAGRGSSIAPSKESAPSNRVRLEGEADPARQLWLLLKRKGIYSPSNQRVGDLLARGDGHALTNLSSFYLNQLNRINNDDLLVTLSRRLGIHSDSVIQLESLNRTPVAHDALQIHLTPLADTKKVSLQSEPRRHKSSNFHIDGQHKKDYVELVRPLKQGRKLQARTNLNQQRAREHRQSLTLQISKKLAHLKTQTELSQF